MGRSRQATARPYACQIHEKQAVCPNCGTALAKLIEHGRTVLRCPRGHGRALSDYALRSWVVDEFQDDFASALHRGRPDRRPCPRCKKPLSLSTFYRLPIEHCRPCALVWVSDSLLERLPLRPEKERERAGSKMHLPVEVRFDPNLESVKEFYSPFVNVKKGKEHPYATVGIILLCLMVTYSWWALGRPDAFIAEPRNPFRLFGAPMLAALFTHSNWAHFLGNSYFLFSAGSLLESHIGWKKFLALFFLCGFASTAAHGYFQPNGLLGASGAISGVIIALVATQPEGSFALRPSLLGVPLLGSLFTITIKLPIWLWAFGWFGFDLYAMGQQLQGQGDNVAHAAHLGGALLGALMAGLAFSDAESPAPKRVKA